MTAINLAQPQFDLENNLAKQSVNVHKFGGSSLANAECINRVVDIIRTHCQLDDIIIVSANGDTTDQLLAIYHLANEQAPQLSDALNELAIVQRTLIAQLLPENARLVIETLLNEDLNALTHWLANDAVNHYSDILALGELWSARLLSAVLAERICPSYYLDARNFLVVDNSDNCRVDTSLSSKQLRLQLQKHQLVVITGYIAKDSRGQNCTLGRNGSDYSATIMASLLGAKNVTLWTDVDGIYSADPRVVPAARKLHRLPADVAQELGRLGNPVLHAKTLMPLTDHSTHLHVASSFAPESHGTEIGEFGQIAKQELSVTHLNDVLMVSSDSFLSEQGKLAAEEFSAVCVDHNSGFIVIRQHQQQAVSQWIASHDTKVIFTPVSLIAVVGFQVAQRGDIRARFNRALRSEQPLAVVASYNKHSLIALLPHGCTGETLNNIHHDLTKDARHIGLVVAGLGNIGERFLAMLPAQLTKISALEHVHLVGLLSSTKALIDNDGIDATKALARFATKGKEYDPQQLLEWLSHHPYDDVIVVDITPSEAFSLLYPQFFARGIHVISANKWAASSDTAHYQKLVLTAAQHQACWLGNTTVGAGLPINYGIKDLIASGDQITEISGIFSGTLSWLFQNFDGQVPFSQLLQQALSEGLTEPDPRDDLSGKDVQRKLLILARAAGFKLDLADIRCQNLVPESLRTLSVDDFLANSWQLDDDFAQQLAKAEQRNACLRYIARFELIDGKCQAQVALEQLPKQHAFANLTACDNIFQVKSHWYQDNALIIRGPGAGRDVTAGGLHSDLVTLCRQLVNRPHQVKIKGIN